MAVINDDETNTRAKACVAEVQAVLERHGFVMGHGDSQGAFKLVPRECLGDALTYQYAMWLDGFYVTSE